jgi:hypothetical protein
MNTRNVVHLNEAASLRAQVEMPSGGASWPDATRPARSTWTRWAKNRPTATFHSVFTFGEDTTNEDEDPSLWHD